MSNQDKGMRYVNPLASFVNGFNHGPIVEIFDKGSFYECHYTVPKSPEIEPIAKEGANICRCFQQRKI